MAVRRAPKEKSPIKLIAFLFDILNTPGPFGFKFIVDYTRNKEISYSIVSEP